MLQFFCFYLFGGVLVFLIYTLLSDSKDNWMYVVHDTEFQTLTARSERNEYKKVSVVSI